MRVLKEWTHLGMSVVVTDDKYNHKAEVVLTPTEALLGEAQMAKALIEKWGLVAGETDGEDTTGRQKMRRLKAEELVTEACETARLAMKEFRERGWIVSLPSLTEAETLVSGEKEEGV